MKTTDLKKEIKRCKKDFVYFVDNYCVVKSPYGLLDIKLLKHQKKAFKLFDKNQFLILKKRRQTGATTLEILYALWKALFDTHQYIFILSDSRMMAERIMHMLRTTYDNLPKQLRGKLLTDNKGEMQFATQSRVVSRVATYAGWNALCSDTPSILMLDEAAFFGNKNGEDLAAEMFFAAEPALCLGGKCIIVSTRNKKSGFFWNTFKEAKKGNNQFTATEWN